MRVTTLGQEKTYSPFTWRICGIVMRVLAITVAVILGLSYINEIHNKSILNRLFCLILNLLSL